MKKDKIKYPLEKNNFPPISPLMAEIKEILDEHIKPAYNSVKGKTVASALIVEMLFKKAFFGLKHKDLRNGEFYTTHYINQGLYIFMKGLPGYYRNDPERGMNYYVPSEGDFTPSNGFNEFRYATPEEVALLKNK